MCGEKRQQDALQYPLDKENDEIKKVVFETRIPQMSIPFALIARSRPLDDPCLQAQPMWEYPLQAQVVQQRRQQLPAVDSLPVSSATDCVAAHGWYAQS